MRQHFTRLAFKPIALSLLVLAALPVPAAAAAFAFAGARNNVTPIVGAPGGRCGASITVSFSPGNLSASGTSNLGGFDFVGSHCIAGMPPGPYTDGVYEWQFADGTLLGTYSGVLNASPIAGVLDSIENIQFLGGTGIFADASGFAIARGTLSFGLVDGVRVSIGRTIFEGTLSAPGIPEPANWIMMILGFGLVGTILRWRTATLVPA